ncbi:MAG: hypothetical protein ACHQRJ_19940, partial [Alphaproteobacteria bacterium]
MGQRGEMGEVRKPAAASEVLARMSRPVFLAGIDGGTRARVTLHVAPEHKRSALAAEAEAALACAGIAARCRVRAIAYRRLARARSLEEALQPFRHEALLHDPTHAVRRAGALLRAVRRIAAALREELRGAYLEPASRTLYLVLSPDTPAGEGGVAAARRPGIEARVANALAAWGADGDAHFPLEVRLGTTLPDVPVIAVDRASRLDRPRRRRWFRRLRGGGLVGAITALFGAGLSHGALADGPAVSEPNAKLSIEGGAANGNPTGYVSGSGTVPLGDSFGAQLDAALGKSGGFLWGVGGQGFWRDPAQGLLGGFGVHIRSNGIDFNRFGGEGEAYLGPFTLEGAAGYQDGSVKSGGFGRVKLSWYPIEDLKFTAGAEYNPVRPLGLGGVEYQPGIEALPGLAFFADGGVSGKGAEFGLLGIRYYFGTTKSLIRRHREDDPPNTFEDNFPRLTSTTSPPPP